jgi:hypothetical protein
MKIILTAIVSILLIANLNAMCAWNGLSAFPSGKTIRPNSIIVIDGYEASQEIVKGLKEKYPVYLVSEKDKIKLTVKEILVGQFNITQAVLTPETNLTLGLNYKLVIDKLPNDEFLGRWNSELKINEPIVYTVVMSPDTTNPIFYSQPREIKKTLFYLGCGPSVNVLFDCNVIDSSEYLVKATVKNLKSRNETSYFLVPSNGVLKIGHDMCSGAFKLEDGDNFEIEFAIMDASGNYTAWIGDRIKFTKPTDKEDK